MITGPYVAVATALDRLHAWWDSKREEWAVAGLVVDDVAAGWVPEPEMVGQAPDVEALSIPSEVAEARPVDLDGCTSCQGQGEVEQIDPVLGDWIWKTCLACCGTGERGAA